MAACEDCGGKAGLLSTICPKCAAARSEKAKREKIAANAKAEEQRQQIISEEYKRILSDVKNGFPCFLYSTHYVTTDPLLSGANFEINPYDDGNVKLAGLEGWKVVGVIPHTFGEVLTNTQGMNKIWAGGFGGNVIGAYVLMELSLNASNVDRLSEEIEEYLQKTVN